MNIFKVLDRFDCEGRRGILSTVNDCGLGLLYFHLHRIVEWFSSLSGWVFHHNNYFMTLWRFTRSAGPHHLSTSAGGSLSLFDNSALDHPSAMLTYFVNPPILSATWNTFCFWCFHSSDQEPLAWNVHFPQMPINLLIFPSMFVTFCIYVAPINLIKVFHGIIINQKCTLRSYEHPGEGIQSLGAGHPKT